jgi:ferritin-like metal-binding protein YciE
MALLDVLIDELRDMYSAENQLVKALPKLARGAKNPELKQLFTAHLDETKEQVLRLRTVFEHLGKKPTGKHCSGMEGVVEEGKEALEEDMDDASFDSGLIGAALHTEHYEVAGYTACIAMAQMLELPDAVELLQQNLNEELAAAEKIQRASKSIFQQALDDEVEDEDSEPESSKSAKEKTTERKSKQDEKAASSQLKKRSSKKA